MIEVISMGTRLGAKLARMEAHLVPKSPTKVQYITAQEHLRKHFQIAAYRHLGGHTYAMLLDWLRGEDDEHPMYNRGKNLWHDGEFDENGKAIWHSRTGAEQEVLHIIEWPAGLQNEGRDLRIVRAWCHSRCMSDEDTGTQTYENIRAALLAHPPEEWASTLPGLLKWPGSDPQVEYQKWLAADEYNGFSVLPSGGA